MTWFSKQIDIRQVSSLVPDTYRNATARIARPELERLIAKVKAMIKAGNIEQDQTSPIGEPFDPTFKRVQFIIFDSQRSPRAVLSNFTPRLNQVIFQVAWWKKWKRSWNVRPASGLYHCLRCTSMVFWSVKIAECYSNWRILLVWGKAFNLDILFDLFSNLL